MSESLAERRSLLELSPAERDERGIETDTVREALVAVVNHGDRTQKTFEDCTFPELELDYHDVGRDNNHPVEFRGCTFEEGFSVEHADVMVPLRFVDCEVGGMEVEDAHFEYDVEVVDSRVTAPVNAEESRFDRDCEFAGTVFTAETRLEEITCGDDASFAETRFEAPVSFRGGSFAGKSNEMDDNASFSDAVFTDAVDFGRVDLGACDFSGATFQGPVEFEDGVFDGDAWFRGTTFGDEAHFAEATFAEDATFEGAAFAAGATFEGAEFRGGARTLEDDVRFVGATFGDDADFSQAELRYSNLADATFEGAAVFEETWFEADADFDGATFEGLADFDEVRFVEDADFSETTFEGEAVFRGAEFRGHANRIEDNASFEGAVFADDANFADAEFTSANFMRVEFAGVIDFEEATFSDRIDALVLATDDDPYVNLTDATVRGGTITQPDEGWVRYDLTRASVGDIDLRSAREGDGSEQLLDYFRFCNTVFDEFDGNEFDFSAHTGYLDRNEWVLHTFDDPVDRSYAVWMTPEVIETTYLNAKNSASAAGDMKAAGEFRVKRQQYARQKHLGIAGDGGADFGTRVRNGVRAVENGFLGVTCGHGMRLFRIFAVFAVVPAFFAVLYAFGGQPFVTSAGQPESLSAAFSTADGRATFFELVSFSYITFLTIGYGNIGPQGWAARLVAPLQVYVSVILSGLVLYALIKRSEM